MSVEYLHAYTQVRGDHVDKTLRTYITERQLRALGRVPRKLGVPRQRLRAVHDE